MVSSSDDEDFATYGNALEPIEEDAIPKKKPITIEDQFAVDEHGRRRFHGAFTGGFQAGFCNTVGSLEGWQPSTFKSSRGSRAESKSQSVFDFMDAEDQGEHGFCPMSLKVKPTFENKTPESSVRKRAREIASEGPIPGVPVAHQLFVPVRDTVGVKLLMKMGWRPGQGVGPRVTKKEKKQIKKQYDVMKVYGCSLPTDRVAADSDSGSESEFDINLDDITFAPDDHQPYTAEPKQNTFGLGYTGLDKDTLSSSQRSLSKLTVNGKTIRGHAFGVSVFEEDDDDIYVADDMSKYDFTLGPEEKASKKVNSSEGCIDGFHISLKPRQVRERFPLPTVPADFVPLKSRKFRWDAKEPSSTAAKTKISSAEERTRIIDDDEAGSKTDPKSAELEAVIAENLGVVADTGYSFKPFAGDQEKQSRYEKFLIFRKLGVKDRLASVQPTTMTAWQKEHERTEFEKAAKLYRPLSQDMADRFTSGGVQEDVHDILKPVTKHVNLELQTRQEAARKKLFGVLTRRKYGWAPDRILCKRFNIPEPAANSLEKAAENTQTKSRNTGSIFEFLKTEANVQRPRWDDEPEAETPQPSTSSEAAQTDVDETQAATSSEPSSEPRNEVTEPASDDVEPVDDVPDTSENVDLFKAIFLSSSEDEDEENDPSAATAETSQVLDKIPDFKLKYSPPRGIFANLDLDSMRKRPPASTSKSSSVEKPATETSGKSADELKAKEDLYGPALPMFLTASSADRQRSTDRSKKKDKKEKKEKWVEKSHKQKKQKKHKKHKSKDK